MIRHDVEQGSVAWINLRLARPTASQAHRIITPRTMKPSGGQEKYLAELVAEWALGRSVTDDASLFMDRGSEMEEEAVAWYEMRHDCDVDRVGFITLDDGSAGASPDGFVGDEGGLEVKIPAAHTHIAYLLDPLSDDYKAQIQMNLLISERAYWDRLSYHPTLPKALNRFLRDEPFINALRAALADFTGRLAEAKQCLLDLGCVPVEPLVPEKISTEFAGVP